jgi:two-component system LytT family sensor kinase
MKMSSLRKWFGHWPIAVGLWAMIVLVYSTRISTQMSSWLEMLKFTAADWFIWVLFAPLIIHLDKRIPVSRDAFIKRFLCHIPLSLLVTVFTIYGRSVIIFMAGVGEQTGNPAHPLDVLWRSFRGGFHFHLLIYWAIIGINLAYGYSNLLKDREISLSEARLNTLRSQMHPHFLFNALNTISAHVDIDARIARRMLEQLGELLRYSLDYSEEQKIPLAEEIAFIERYLALQKARYKKRLEVRISVDPETLYATIPTFILTPLVENAVVHGIAAHFQKGVVEICAKREKDRLHLSVRDDGPGLPPGWNLGQAAGIGIRNTRERLRCLYREEDFAFNVTNAEGGGVLAEIVLPFHSGNGLSDRDINYAKNSRVNCG